MSVEALAKELEKRDWPGNVGELRSAVERIVVLGLGACKPDDAEAAAAPRSAGPGAALVSSVATFEAHAGAMLDEALPFHVAKERAVERWEQSSCSTLMGMHAGNLSRAARR